ncbi:IclR family transcriptional regulator [Sedimentibacter sp.]|uniref:IclR family transcriptional regulator n=1 Tax=Sedimentibacter sp. TaxID=1960295 RepID=UPI0028ABC755|nr:IclR family transcriptional regulator [Sedimentibacter sp.]
MDLVQSIDRALTILEVLSNYNEGLGVTEISQEVGLHKSTVYRLLSTLIYKGYVIQDMDTNKYKITLKLFELGSKKVENMDLLSASKTFTRKLMETVNEVVHLVVRDGNEIVYIDKVEANNTIRMASTIGKRGPMYSTATGKVILAFMSENQCMNILNNSKLEMRTDKTIVDIEILKKQLKEIKSRGYAVDDEENEIGVRCVGAPIFNRHGEIEGAISLSGPSNRVTEEKVETIAIEVMKYAHLISEEIGYRK